MFYFIYTHIFFPLRHPPPSTSVWQVPSSSSYTENVAASMLRGCVGQEVCCWLLTWLLEDSELELFWGAVVQKYPVLERSERKKVFSEYLLDQALFCCGSCGGGSKLCCVTQQPLGWVTLELCHCLHCSTWVGRWKPPVGRAERQLAPVMLSFCPITWFLASSLCLHPC